MYTETHQERKLIFKKSEIMCIGLGCLKDKMEDVYGISETNIRKILGIFWGKTKEAECEISNLKDKVQNIIQILNLWRQRDSTIQGRAVVLNTTLTLKLLYLIPF